MFDELVKDNLVVVIFLVLKTCERTYANDIAVASHYRNGLQNVLRLVTVHNHSAFGLEFPCSLVYVEYNDVHAKVQGCLLCAESCAQARVEEHHHEGLVLAELAVSVTV